MLAVVAASSRHSGAALLFASTIQKPLKTNNLKTARPPWGEGADSLHFGTRPNPNDDHAARKVLCVGRMSWIMGPCPISADLICCIIRLGASSPARSALCEPTKRCMDLLDGADGHPFENEGVRG